MLTKKSFYIIRHGQTVANKENYAAGHLDTPLTQLGISQADEAREMIKRLKEKPDIIFHSNLSRARDTASIINENLNLKMIENSDLAEQNYGDWTKVEWKIIKEQQNNGIIDPPNGECETDFNNRSIKGISAALSTSNSLPLIVCHGGVFNSLFKLVDIEPIDIGNCDIYYFYFCNNNNQWSFKNL